jgi:hypothetical protein
VIYGHGELVVLVVREVQGCTEADQLWVAVMAQGCRDGRPFVELNMDGMDVYGFGHVGSSDRTGNWKMSGSDPGVFIRGGDRKARHWFRHGDLLGDGAR